MPIKIAAPNRRLRLGRVPWSLEALPSQGSAVGELGRSPVNDTGERADKPPAYSYVNGRRSVAHRARDAGQPLKALIGARRFITVCRVPFTGEPPDRADRCRCCSERSEFRHGGSSAR